MTVKYFFIAAVTIALTGNLRSAAQDTRQVPVTFEAMYGTTPLTTDRGYLYRVPDVLQLETFRFYISGIALYQGNTLQWKEPASNHLLDAGKPATMRLTLNVPAGIHFNNIKFNLGIDSLTNVSGALGGDLDPSKGMYWTWQSGYINLKLEGKSYTHGRTTEFRLHLGGYSAPYASVQQVRLAATDAKPIQITVDVARLLMGIDLARQNNIMIPGEDAVRLSRKAVSMFRTKK